MSINILLNGKLIRLDNDSLSADAIVNALGYTPADKSQLFSGSFNDLKDNPIFDNGDGALSFADSNGNLIAKIDKDGITTTGINTKTVTLNGEDLEEKINKIKGAILNSILDDESDSFSLVDPDGNIIFRVDKEGTATTEIILGATDEDKIAVKETLQNILDQLANISFEETDPTVPSWAKQPDKPTYFYSEIKDAPIQEDNSGALDIVDAEGRIAAKIDGNGTRVAKLFVGEEKANEKDIATQLNELATNKVDKDSIGVAGGLASLDINGHVPSSQLPSYVDDVLEFDNREAFPMPGETDKIYLAIDSNKSYRWGGTTYVEISSSIALGETSSTAYPGDKGAAAAQKANEAFSLAEEAKSTIDNHEKRVDNPHQVTRGQLGLDNIQPTEDGTFALVDPLGNKVLEVTNAGGKTGVLVANDVIIKDKDNTQLSDKRLSEELQDIKDSIPNVSAISNADIDAIIAEVFD